MPDGTNRVRRLCSLCNRMRVSRSYQADTQAFGIIYSNRRPHGSRSCIGCLYRFSGFEESLCTEHTWQWLWRAALGYPMPVSERGVESHQRIILAGQVASPVSPGLCCRIQKIKIHLDNTFKIAHEIV